MQNRATHLIASFAAMFVFWVVLSGRFDSMYLGLGLVSSALVVAMTNRFLYTWTHHTGYRSERLFVTLLPWHGLLIYFPWLMLRVIQANLEVAYVVLHPRLPIDPIMVRFQSGLHSDAAQVILANSITLTPGTVTIDVRDGIFLVHALRHEAASMLQAGEAQRKVATIFHRVEEEPPEVQFTRRPYEDENPYYQDEDLYEDKD